MFDLIRPMRSLSDLFGDTSLELSVANLANHCNLVVQILSQIVNASVDRVDLGLALCVLGLRLILSQRPQPRYTGAFPLARLLSAAAKLVE